MRHAANLAVPHGFLTREGGVSSGIYASLNCGRGSGDDPGAVAENRRRAAARFGLDVDRLVTPHQIHSTTIMSVTEPWPADQAPRCDGLVTNRTGIVLGVLAADCAPVLLEDAEAGVIGAAHAGWRGALAGVVDATVAAMEALGARRGQVQAAIGPCIGPDSYEVGPEFRQSFEADDPGNAQHFHVPFGGRDHFDLAGYLVRRIAGIGVKAVTHVAADTAADPGQWFSYRRSCQRGEPGYGRQLSAITLA